MSQLATVAAEQWELADLDQPTREEMVQEELRALPRWAYLPIRASRAGTCYCCLRAIEPGQPICYTRSGRRRLQWHSACHPQPVQMVQSLHSPWAGIRTKFSSDACSPDSNGSQTGRLLQSQNHHAPVTRPGMNDALSSEGDVVSSRAFSFVPLVVQVSQAGGHWSAAILLLEVPYVES